MTRECLSTRLFPKNQGATGYKITGLAARCDWVLLSDWQAPKIALIRQQPGPPRHIFLSMRAPFPALLHFAQNILPELSAPFVLISGSEDITLPNQVDHRWRRYTQDEQAAIQTILNSPFLCGWFVENLDDASAPKMHPLPLGVVHPASSPTPDWPAPRPFADRPLRVLCAHRVREGPQWSRRRQVTQYAKGPWQPWTTVVDHEVSETEFAELLEAHAFVLCVQGGGLDPAPKAWQALMHGALPIYHAPSLRAAYDQLPCVHVEDWTEDAITPERLRTWQAWARPKMDGPEAREHLKKRLSLDYWWTQILNVRDIP